MMRATLVLTLLAPVAVGCRPRQDPPAPSRAPLATAPAVGTFTGQGVRLNYPTQWTPVSSNDFVLRLVPADAARHAAAPAVSLDVPKLPPHIPGFIPLGAVVNGYIDDMKKQHAGVHVEESTATKVAGANARRVRSTWQQAGRTLSEDAVLTVHGDRVYIFRANARAEEADAARTVLDGILDSVIWE